MTDVTASKPNFSARVTPASGMTEKVVSICCCGYRLETSPTKHHSYEIRVKWTDRETVIYRRYSQFFTLQCTLLDDFPAEAGTYNPEKRIIPFLPGKKFIGNLTEKTAEKRKAKLDAYLKDLVKVQSIAQSQTFLKFCRSKEADLERFIAKSDQGSGAACQDISEPLVLPQYRALFDYRKCQHGEIDLTAGDVLLVIDKKQTGWWLVQSEYDGSQGWAPASFLEPTSSLDADADKTTQLSVPDKYVATRDYTAGSADELTVRVGAYVDVYKKSVDGWWSCSVSGKRGLLPAAYLSKVNSKKARSLQSRAGAAPPSSGRRQSLSKYAPPRPAKKTTKSSVRPPRPPPPVVRKKVFTAIADFTPSSPTDSVLNEDTSGWWYVESEGRQGWAPSTYLQPSS